MTLKEIANHICKGMFDTEYVELEETLKGSKRSGIKYHIKYNKDDIVITRDKLQDRIIYSKKNYGTFL